MMNLIVIPLGAFLASGIGFLAVRALIGLGMGTLTYAAIGVAFDQLFTLAQGSLQQHANIRAANRRPCWFWSSHWNHYWCYFLPSDFLDAA